MDVRELLTKLQTLPASNVAERDTTLNLLTALIQRLDDLEERVSSLEEGEPDGEGA